MSERTVTVRLRALISDYQKAMQTAAGDSKKFAAVVKGNFTQLNQDVGKLGESMTRKVTLPLVATGAGALKLASDFETSFAQMVGLAGVTGDEVAGLREEIMKLSQQTAAGPQKLAEALYFVRSSGIDAAHAMEIVGASAKAAAAGMGEPAVIARTLSAAINAYGASNLSAAHATDVLVAGIRAASFEPDQLAASLGTVIATASTMGITFDNLIATLAVLSRTGMDAAEATTSLNAILSMLSNGGAAATQLLESHGLSLQKLRDIAAGPGGVVEAMRLLDKTFGDDQEALSTIIPNVRAFRGAMTLLAQDGTIVDKVMQDVGDSAGSLDEAFAAMNKTDAFKIKQAFVDLQVTLIQLGATIAPIAAQFAQGFGTIVGLFDSLPKPIQELVVLLAVFAAAAGPVAKGISLIGNVVGPVIRQLAAMRAALIASQMAGMSYGQALGQMANGMAMAAASALPLMALVTGLTLLFLDNAQAARDARERILGLADAIEKAGSVTGGVTAALTGAVKVNQELASSFAEAGVTVTDVSAALALGGDAWTAMSARILDGGKAAGLTELQMQMLITVLRNLPGDTQAAQTHLENLSSTTATTGSSMQGLGQTADELGISLHGMSTGLDDVAGAAGTSVRASEAQARAWDIANQSAVFLTQGVANLVSMIGALFGATFDVGDAQQGFADAVTDVDGAMRTGGGSARDYAKEQRALEDATKDVTKAQQELKDAEAALTEARKGPTTREKSDAALDVREATLAVKEATRAQADARKKLLEERDKGKEGDVAGARLDVEAASIRLKRAQDRLTDSQKAQNDVLHSGEETSKDVKSALDDLEAAQDRVADATQRQMDAEATLRGDGAGGGPVADRARTLRGAYDNLATSGQSWITKLIESGAPTSAVVTALGKQRDAIQEVIDKYGDANGKLSAYLEWLKAIERQVRLKDSNDPSAIGQGGADYGGVSIGPDGRPVSVSGGRASGGPVKPFTTYEMGEEGPEALTFGATRQPQSFDMAPPDKLGKGAAELSNRSAMGARTFMVGLDGPQFITMGAQGGWVTPNDKLGDIDGARAKGGPVLPGRTYLVGERGAEILTVGGFWQQRTADPTAGQSVTNYVTQRDSVTPGYGNGDAQTGGAATVAVSVADGPYRMTEQGPVLLVPTPGASGANTSSMYATATNSATTLSTATTYTVGLNGPEVITMGSLPGWVHSDVHLLEGRASGGPVAAGQTVVVGENGPEIITVAGQSTGRLPQRTASGPTPTGGRDPRSVAEIVAERTAKTAALRRAAVERRAMNTLARTAAAPGSSAIGATGGIEAANYQSGNEGLGVAAPSTVGPSVNEDLRNSAMPWSGQLAAASSASAPGPIALEVNVAVQGDFVKVANELVRLSKQNGGLPIRIRSGN